MLSWVLPELGSTVVVITQAKNIELNLAAMGEPIALGQRIGILLCKLINRPASLPDNAPSQSLRL
ncbi:MAG: hypothetical protein R3C68_07020 [Myxococcota bacterium]